MSSSTIYQGVNTRERGQARSDTVRGLPLVRLSFSFTGMFIVYECPSESQSELLVETVADGEGVHHGLDVEALLHGSEIVQHLVTLHQDHFDVLERSTNQWLNFYGVF